LAGCGGGSSSSDKVTPAKATVSGVVNKGLVQNGLVEVCPATAANIKDEKCVENVLASTTTGEEDGRYSLADLPQNQALLFVLKKHPEKNTQMKCDYQACIKDDTKFGDFFPVADDFKLISILAPDAETITAHMTSITDTIARHTIRASRGATEINPDVINSSRQVVAELFNISPQRVMALGGVDLTNSDEIKKAQRDGDNDSLKVAALSAAFADTDPDLDSLFKLADALITDSSTVIDSDDAERKKLLAGAGTVIETVFEQNPSLDLSAVTASINQAKDEIPTVTPPKKTDDITKAQDLVKQVRTVYNAAGEEGDLRLGLTQWGDSLQAIPSELFEKDIAQTFEVLQSGLMSIAHRVDVRLKGEAGEYDEAISAADGVYTLKIDDTLDLAVVASVNWPEGGEPTVGEDGWQREQDHAPKIELTITRLSVTSGEVTLTAESGLAQVIEFKSQEARLENNKPWDDEAQEYAYSYEEEYALTADKLALKLEGVTLTAKDQNKKTIELSGTITFNADKAKVAGVELNNNQSNWKDGPNEGSYTKFESQTIAAEKLNLTFNTELNYLEQLAKLNLAINLDNPANKVVYLSCMRDAASWIDEHHTSSNQNEDGLYLGSSKCSKDGENWSLDEETATDFLRGSVTASLETEVNPEKPQLAKVSLQAARPAFDLLNVNGAVVYNNQTLNLKTQINTLAEDQKLTVVLANTQATAVLREGDKKGEILGDIKVGNKTVASIEYANGTTVVRYIGGQFESLF
ncbi:hypothetical protein M3921_002677, partial [Vibrio metschnikovii]|nr:hypothetical protein [Vibrio metschnikovii]EKO3750430.1 hypothetical protein [Vibrio metschnikovii]